MSRLDDWADAVVAELGLPGGVDVREVLDLAKDVAHGVDRPAAPLTSWLAGMAIGAGAEPADVVARIRRLVAAWEQ